MSLIAAGLVVAVVDAGAAVPCGESDHLAMTLIHRMTAMRAITAKTAHMMTSGRVSLRCRSIGVTVIGSSKLLRNSGGRGCDLGAGGMAVLSLGWRRGARVAAAAAAAVNSRAES